MTKPAGSGTTKGKPRATPRERSRGRTIDPKTRARILELARAERSPGRRWSQYAIAKEVGVASSSVGRIVREEWPDFDWGDAAAQTAKAAAAHTDDLKAARASLAADTLAEARRLLGLLTAPHEVIHWDKDGGLHRGTIERPTSGDVKNYAIAIGVLTDKHLTLVRADSDDRDLPAVDLFLAHIMGGGKVPA